MSADFQHLRLSMEKEVVLVEIMSRDLVGPVLAQELGVELATVAGQEWAKRLVVDCSRIGHLSSAGFAVLLKLASQAVETGREVKFCSMQSGVRLGADIAGLGQIAELHENRKAALASFSNSESGN